MELHAVQEHLKLLADPTRLRLLSLLDAEELTVAELAAVTRLAQPRISTHLAKLREGGLVLSRRDGTSVYYRANGDRRNGPLNTIWQQLIADSDDPLLRADKRRLPEVLRERAAGQHWADAVAGDMERHYSPGRTWEATARAMVELVSLGDVLDIASGDGALDELIAPRAKSLTCLDISHAVMSAGRDRLKGTRHVRFCQGSMEALPLPDRQFDQVLLLHALTYTTGPEQVFAEAYRVMRPEATLLGATLRHHNYNRHVQPFGHVNNGFEPEQLEKMCRDAGLTVLRCEVSSRERRTPHFEVVTFTAIKGKT